MMLCVQSVACHHRAVFAPASVARRSPPRLAPLRAGNAGKDVLGGAVDGWLDMASFVSGGSANKSPYSDLAYKIGSDVYVDISGWHLYLRDLNAAPGIKMADALASKLGTEVADIGYSEAMVRQVLSLVPVTLGKGKVELPLLDVIPDSSLRDLYRAVEDHARSR